MAAQGSLKNIVFKQYVYNFSKLFEKSSNSLKALFISQVSKYSFKAMMGQDILALDRLIIIILLIYLLNLLFVYLFIFLYSIFLNRTMN